MSADDANRRIMLAATTGRMDSWESALTGLNQRTRDKRMASEFVVRPITQIETEELWRGNDVAARIIEKPVDEQLREGFTVLINIDDSLKLDALDPAAMFGQPAPQHTPGPINRDNTGTQISDDLIALLDDLGWSDAFSDVMYYERAHGAGAIFMGLNDGQSDLSRPVNLDALVSVDFLTTFSPREFFPVSWYSNPLAKNYGKPEIYSIQPDGSGYSRTEPMGATTFEVHESRLIVFQGKAVSRAHRLANNGHGDSYFLRCQKVIRDFDLTWDSTAALVADFSQAVFKIKGLAQAFAAGKSKLITDRALVMDICRSTTRAIMIDADGEDFQRVQTPMAGLPEVLDKFYNRLATAADMPVTLMAGQAPAGLNATGDSDVRNWYATIASKQTKHLKPRLEKLIKYLLRSQCGPTQGYEPPSWQVKFKPLYQLTSQERALLRKTYAEIDDLNIRNGVYTPEDAAGSRYAGEEFGEDITLDLEARQQMAAIAAATEPAPVATPELGAVPAA